MFEGVTALAPAKINLGLKVFPRRTDGYHEIASIFTSIQLYDVLTIEPLEKENTCIVDCDVPGMPQDNTITKAYKAFCVLTGINSGVHVFIKKRIPAGGGLGGGSSDASSFIQSLDNIFSTKLSSQSLRSIAGSVGSDCYFFTERLIACGKDVTSTTSFASLVEGRGEIIKPIKARTDFHILLLLPGDAVSTKMAYALLDQTDLSKREGFDSNSLIVSYCKDVKDWNFENDFTPIVQKEHNLIHVAMEDLKSTGAQFVQMSGSGSTLFAVYVEKEQAIAATNKLKEKWHLVLV